MSHNLYLVILLLSTFRLLLAAINKQSKATAYLDLGFIFSIFVTAVLVVVNQDVSVYALLTRFDPLRYELSSYTTTSLIRFIKIMPILLFNMGLCKDIKKSILYFLICFFMSISETRIEYLGVIFILISWHYNKSWEWKKLFIIAPIFVFIFIELHKYGNINSELISNGQFLDYLLILYLITNIKKVPSFVDKISEIVILCLVSTINSQENLLKICTIIGILVLLIYILATTLVIGRHFNQRVFRQVLILLPIIQPEMIVLSFCGLIMLSDQEINTKLFFSPHLSEHDLLLLPTLLLLIMFLLIFKSVGATSALTPIIVLVGAFIFTAQVKIHKNIFENKSIEKYMIANGVVLLAVTFYYL